jgi:hypothetical protein
MKFSADQKHRISKVVNQQSVNHYRKPKSELKNKTFLTYKSNEKNNIRSF